MGNESGYLQRIEFEGNLSYCYKCKVNGHSFDNCRKRQKEQKESKVDKPHGASDLVKSQGIDPPHDDSHIMTNIINTTPSGEDTLNQEKEKEISQEGKEWTIVTKKKAFCKGSTSGLAWKDKGGATLGMSPHLNNVEVEPIVDDLAHGPKVDEHKVGETSTLNTEITPNQFVKESGRKVRFKYNKGDGLTLGDNVGDLMFGEETNMIMDPLATPREDKVTHKDGENTNLLTGSNIIIAGQIMPLTSPLKSILKKTSIKDG